MHNKEAIGIGGVMAEVAWLTTGSSKHADKNAVPEAELISCLCERFGVTEDVAFSAIQLAEQCGVVTRIEGSLIRLLPRPN